MAMMFDALSERHIEFIRAQKIYFTGTATADSRINVSPKGMDSLRVLGGNETSAHVQADARMTLMFCAFEGAPLILRLYGRASVIHRKDPQWAALYPQFTPLPGARQIFDLAITHVQTSCGMGVPLMDYQGERGSLEAWAEKKGDSGLLDYWAQKNQSSIDGLPTHIVARNNG
jgi:hypothetical protein